MSTVTTSTDTRVRAPRRIGSVVAAGLTATVCAAAATAAVAALGHAAGISLDVAGQPIPVLGFATLTAFFSAIGIVLAVVLARTVGSPRRAFVRTTVALTALSLVPDAIAPAGGVTIALLMTTHLVAAAIVIPAIARRLSR
jgi:Family of unknown function (DUF6069)